MGNSYDGEKRRQYVRVLKSYKLLFKYKNSPQELDTTFIKDISKGGVRFTTSKNIKPGTELLFEISVPHIAPKKLILEGLVISSVEVTPRWVYEIRAQFNPLDEQAIQIIDMIEKQNLKDQKNHGLH